MNKKEIKKVEDKILNFFRIKEKIIFLENVIISLEEKVEDLQEKNRALNLDFNIDIKGVSMNGMPSGGNHNSYFENNIIKQIEQNENIINKTIEDISNKKLEIERLKIENTLFENIFSLLPEQDIDILKLRYTKNFSEISISHKLNVSVAQYHRNKNKIFENIYNLLLINGEIGI